MLQKITLQLIPENDCVKAVYGSVEHNSTTMICAGQKNDRHYTSAVIS